MRYVLAALLLASCSSAPQRVPDADQEQEQEQYCTTGTFTPNDPLTKLSLQDAIELCDEFCASRGNTASDVFWMDKGHKIGCICGCRKIEGGAGPKE